MSPVCGIFAYILPELKVYTTIGRTFVFFSSLGGTVLPNYEKLNMLNPDFSHIPGILNMSRLSLTGAGHADVEVIKCLDQEISGCYSSCSSSRSDTECGQWEL